MAAQIPLKEPSEFVAGDTVQWNRKDLSGDYPANGGWTLRYYFYGPKGAIPVDATADGADFSVTISAETSAAFVPGDYKIKGFVAHAGNAIRRIIYDNALKITEDPANVSDAGLDNRSHAKVCLDAIEAVLEGRATRSDRSYTIAGRQTEHYTFEDLIKMRDYYAAIVARENQAAAFARGEGGGQVLVRFSRPS